MHESDNVIAGLLVDDFPKAKFVHTVRDPISSSDASFRFGFNGLYMDYPRAYTHIPYGALFALADKDRPHSGMESRTRTIRFEDLHRDNAEIICDLASWLDLPYQASLRDSTFNGIPYVVSRDGKAWSGRGSSRLSDTPGISRSRIKRSCSRFFMKTSGNGTIPVQRSFDIHWSVVSYLFHSLCFRRKWNLLPHAACSCAGPCHVCGRVTFCLR